jgi:alpha-methylacyl-CoA racemase
MGPLQNIKVLEIEAIGPVPWCGMMLSDLGADVLRIDRPAPPPTLRQIPDHFQFAKRGRRAIVADLKSPAGIARFKQLVAKADVLIEGMRPGVMERLGLGPDECLGINRGLVYGRMTGWGQTGPLADTAGHDINYIALTGALHAIGGRGGPPVPPLNLLGDYGGGGMLLALGICAALVNARTTGQGQVVDAAMIDGITSLMTPLFGQLVAGQWRDERGANTLDGGAPWYGVYETSDRKFIAVGAVEPQFYSALVRGLGVDEKELPARDERERWPETRKRFEEIFRSRTRGQWVETFDGIDACVTPVLSLAEAAEHPHQQARSGFLPVDGIFHPAPAPRFSHTPSRIRGPARERGAGAQEALFDWGIIEAGSESVVFPKAQIVSGTQT